MYLHKNVETIQSTISEPEYYPLRKIMLDTTKFAECPKSKRLNETQCREDYEDRKTSDSKTNHKMFDT